MATRGQPLAAGTIGDAVNGIGMLERRCVAVALPLEKVPLPLAEVDCALVEKLFGAADIVSRQLALDEGDPLSVRRPLLAGERLLGALEGSACQFLLGLDPRVAGCQHAYGSTQA